MLADWLATRSATLRLLPPLPELPLAELALPVLRLRLLVAGSVLFTTLRGLSAVLWDVERSLTLALEGTTVPSGAGL